MTAVHVGEWSGEEQRRHRRVPLGVPVECRAGQTALQGNAVNVSTSGLLIRTETPFPEDEEITVAFSLPGSARVIQCRAQVAHVVPNAFMGAEFLDLPPESSERIEKYIAAKTVTSDK